MSKSEAHRWFQRLAVQFVTVIAVGLWVRVAIEVVVAIYHW